MRAMLVEAAATKMETDPESIAVGAAGSRFQFEQASILAEARFGTLTTAGSTRLRNRGPVQGAGSVRAPLTATQTAGRPRRRMRVPAC